MLAQNLLNTIKNLENPKHLTSKLQSFNEKTMVEAQYPT